MIDTVNLRQTLCNELKSSQKIKDFCVTNFVIGVRVPKAIKTASESEVFLLVDLQIKGLNTPIKSGIDIPLSYYDEESLTDETININTMTNYNGDEVLDSFRDVIV